MNMFKRVCIFGFIGVALVGCTSMFEEDEVTEVVAEQISRDQKSAEKARTWLKNTQKNQAEIAARLDQLEFQNRQQMARIKILEKGMVLGLVPEELRSMYESGKFRPNKKKAAKPKDAVADKATAKKKDVKLTEVKPVADIVEKKDKVPTESNYEQMLAEAQKSFRDGKYGSAILSYEKLMKAFPQVEKDGSAAYWTGVSWMYLREYDNANRYLRKSVTDNPKGPFAPRAHVHLAKIARKQGYEDRALQTLRDVIAKYPNEDAADMARLELESMKKSL